jgi:FemAB-related protein (PEP-CTERM system-associated)
MSATESGVRRYPLLSSGGPAADEEDGRSEPVRVGVWTDPQAWDEFVLRASDGTMAHRWAWLGVVSGTYGHRVIPLAATRAGTLAGVLPLVQMRSRLFGRHLVSMPYLDAGGLCTSGDRAADNMLVLAAAKLATSSGAQLELRHTADRPIPLVPSLHKVTMLMELSGGEDAVRKRIPASRQRQVRKARRAGLTASMNGSEALADLHRILATNLRDLGSPMHRREFFRRIMGAFGEDARIVLIRERDGVIGAGLMLIQGDWAGMPWVGSLRSAFARNPNQLLYWEVFRHAIARGCRVFDFGRSSPGAGTYEAKRQWGAQPVQLYWHRLPGKESGSDVQRWQWGTEVWRRLPVPVASAIGAAVRGGLPQ